MPPTLLADLALMLAKSPEDVATRALELILNRSAEGRRALVRLLDSWRRAPGASVTRWASQVVGVDDARTDMQGYGSDGVLVAIFENKFWAGLTDNQPRTYLDRLRAPDGILVFMVPSSRVSHIANELSMRLQAPDSPRLEFETFGESRVLPLPIGCTLAISSWDTVLSTVASALEAAADSTQLADLRQLQGLVASMESALYRPLTAADITGDTPQLILRLNQILDESVQVLLQSPFANRRNLRATGGMGWYSHYLRLHGFGCQFAISSWLWSRHGISPMWLRVMGRDWKFSEALRLPLQQAIGTRGTLFEDPSDPRGFWIPIRLLEGRERGAVVADVVAQVTRIAQQLALLPPDGLGEDAATSALQDEAELEVLRSTV